MAKLEEVVVYLDELLNTENVPDYSGAMNGLQLASRSGQVKVVASAVDASLPVVREAIEKGADLLVVHHGLFWQGSQRVVGPVFAKLEEAIGAGLAIYSSHIPLDIHPDVGNNALFAKLMGLRDCETFFDWKGIELGVKGNSDKRLYDLVSEIEALVGRAPIVCEGGGENVGVVGLITGGAGSEVEKMAKLGVDTFITGEGPHWSFPLAEELGMNVIHAGHYSTETFGVRELGEILENEYGLEHVFIDRQTGL